jgi:hypothetical protein
MMYIKPSREVISGRKEIKMANVINTNGYELDFESAVMHMDDDIREDLHREMAPCTEQEFFTAYEKAHVEKYGEEWELSKESPTW